MAKKRTPTEDADASRPKQLRKRLRKAEDQLADAVTKRDRAQARVEALSIIADEIRAQLAEVESLSNADAASATSKAPASATRKAPASATRKAPASATRKTPTTTSKPRRSGTSASASEAASAEG